MLLKLCPNVLSRVSKQMLKQYKTLYTCELCNICNNADGHLTLFFRAIWVQVPAARMRWVASDWSYCRNWAVTVFNQPQESNGWRLLDLCQPEHLKILFRDWVSICLMVMENNTRKFIKSSETSGLACWYFYNKLRRGKEDLAYVRTFLLLLSE